MLGTLGPSRRFPLWGWQRRKGGSLNDDTFNMDVRKFLKMVGVTSQREIERAVGEALAAGRLKGDETLQAHVVLTIDGLDFSHDVRGKIALE